jgi:C-terminal processing protease CtpA/Prc
LWFTNASNRWNSTEQNRISNVDTQLKKKFKLHPSKIKDVQAGSGIVLERDFNGNMIVAGLLRGGPAFKTDLVRLGDVLIAIDNTPLEALPAKEIAFLMQGHAGSAVELTFKRLPEESPSPESKLGEKNVFKVYRLSLSQEPNILGTFLHSTHAVS